MVILCVTKVYMHFCHKSCLRKTRCCFICIYVFSA